MLSVQNPWTPSPGSTVSPARVPPPPMQPAGAAGWEGGDGRMGMGVVGACSARGQPRSRGPRGSTHWAVTDSQSLLSAFAVPSGAGCATGGRCSCVGDVYVVALLACYASGDVRTGTSAVSREKGTRLRTLYGYITYS